MPILQGTQKNKSNRRVGNSNQKALQTKTKTLIITRFSISSLLSKTRNHILTIVPYNRQPIFTDNSKNPQ